MTRKLYDLDSHRRDFSATVLRCDPAGERYAVVLDQTVFFPEGGGQPADEGTLDGIFVTDVQEIDGEIWHTERDTYSKSIPEYQEQAATVMAIVTLGVANLDHLLSREGLYK